MSVSLNKGQGLPPSEDIIAKIIIAIMGRAFKDQPKHNLTAYEIARIIVVVALLAGFIWLLIAFWQVMVLVAFIVMALIAAFYKQIGYVLISVGAIALSSIGVIAVFKIHNSLPAFLVVLGVLIAIFLISFCFNEDKGAPIRTASLVVLAAVLAAMLGHHWWPETVPNIWGKLFALLEDWLAVSAQEVGAAAGAAAVK